MSSTGIDPARLALVIIDLQNDFLHADGAYARSGATSSAIAALPARVKPVMDAVRAAGGTIISSHFTLVPGRDGEPLIAPHLKEIRPFLCKGDFLPGAWGHALVDELGPSDFAVEKVAYSAFYMTRLDWLLRKTGIETLAVCGIVTNGGVAATVRDAHLRDYPTILLEDGCAAFSAEIHQASVTSLGTAATVMTCAAFTDRLG